MEPFSVAGSTLTGGIRGGPGGAGGNAGPSTARLDTGGYQGMFGLDGSGWTVATGSATARGGSSGGAGQALSSTMVIVALLGAAALVGVILWKR